MISGLLAAGAKTLGQLGSGLSDILGGDMASRALKRGNSRARNDLTAGYDQGMGFQQPIYDTALNNFQNLSGQYQSGAFKNPHMDPYQFDPNSVFQDPEYQAQMRAGTEAINSNAYTKGNLFSGRNDRDLTRFGQDLFSGRSDALYNRGFNAQNMAFNQNLAGNQQNFAQGAQLAGYLPGAASQLTGLSVDQGQNLANNSLVAGGLRAGNIMNTANAIGTFADQLGGTASNYFAPNFLGGAPQPMQALGGAPFGNAGTWQDQIQDMIDPNKNNQLFSSQSRTRLT
jgi:hypothetical protein